jgi:hypothetical protein
VFSVAACSGRQIYLKVVDIYCHRPNHTTDLSQTRRHKPPHVLQFEQSGEWSSWKKKKNRTFLAAQPRKWFCSLGFLRFSPQLSHWNHTIVSPPPPTRIKTTHTLDAHHNAFFFQWQHPSLAWNPLSCWKLATGNP